MTSPLTLLRFAAVCTAASASRSAPGVESQSVPVITPPTSGLVGTWCLVEFRDRDSTTGRVTFRCGERPTGYFVYDATGHVHVQIAKVRGIVMHQVEGDSRGLYTGTRQSRRYRLVRDSLIIGNDTTGRRALVRVH